MGGCLSRTADRGLGDSNLITVFLPAVRRRLVLRAAQSPQAESLGQVAAFHFYLWWPGLAGSRVLRCREFFQLCDPRLEVRGLDRAQLQIQKGC